jgi:nickel superoxide dismutase
VRLPIGDCRLANKNQNRKLEIILGDLKMNRKRELVLWICIVLVAGVTSQVYSHCQMPCGIYDDPARLATIAEDCNTIEKAMKSITDLSADPKANMNQLVRWVNTKEQHVEDVAHIISFYFLSQRVAPVARASGASYDKYINQLTLLHEMLVASMKCKQTTDLASVVKLRSLLAEFRKSYLGESASPKAGEPSLSGGQEQHSH